MSIEVSNVWKHFGSFTALAGVSLKVETGKLTALLGPSGSGKTTLLRIIAGLEFADASDDPESGRVNFFGEDVTDVAAGRRGVGFVFQHYALFKHMTVHENVAFGLTVRSGEARPSKKEIADRVRELLALVQLETFGGRLPHQLSGGQRQRVALARALAVQPKVLLLDEPFGALDAQVRKDLRRWLRSLHEKLHVTTIFVTHDQEEALELADEVVVMNQARIEQVGDPQTVYDRPASPFVIEFLGNVNRLTAGLGRMNVSNKDVLYVRPHDVDVDRSRRGNHDLAARVLHVFSAGNYGRVSLQRIDTGEAIEAEMSRERLRELRLSHGNAVYVVFKHVRLFPKGRFVEADVADGAILAGGSNPDLSV
ncbi:sulfate ABC transporter ATP-binding protein [Opitutales bacterium ASA1]|uniref:sulfate/molybdate ABC transporter ATP-binding protein n=1 Tax=Congregicoccus parvus TaxID=3081749 RepID=UPI002B3004E2|nr:sulfate ABC transporter ATP-binding protein [Opitutales bacterium ASA1]